MTGGWLIRIAPEVIGVEEGLDVLPQDFTLYQNHPNPFNPMTTINYELPQSSEDLVTVYNVLGEEVSKLVSGEIEAGYHKVTWNASNMASGIYFYRIQEDFSAQTCKILYFK